MVKLFRAALMFIGLAACATPPLPDDHYYRLEISTPIAASNAKGGVASVAIARIRMPGVYSERPLLYSTAQAPTELRQYHYHYWADNPERLVQDQLAGFLRAARVFRDVSLSTNGAVPAEYEINGRVQRFEQRLDGSSARALVEIHLAVARKNDNSSPLISKTYRTELVSSDATALAAAQGLSKALGECYAQFLADLKALVLPAAN